MTVKHWVGLVGYARSGKDAIGRHLAGHGYERRAMGDLIKADLDHVVRHLLGFSAFTEDDSQKELIRPLIIEHGYAFYDYFLDWFFDDLPDMCVNTRIYDVKEARRWVEGGGVIYRVDRPGFGPAEAKEHENMTMMHACGLIAASFDNISVSSPSLIAERIIAAR